MPPRVGVLPLSGFKVFYGWWVVLALSLVNFLTAGGFFFSFTALVNPVREDLELSAAAVSVAFSLRSVESGLLAPLFGFVVDRIGPRHLVFFGSVISGLGMVVLSMAHSLWVFYLAFSLIALGTGASSGIVGMATAAKWFVRRRSRALGVYFAGVGLGGFLVPVMVWLIGQFGWRQALLFDAVAFWAVGILATLVVRTSPEACGLLPDGDIALAAASPAKAKAPRSEPDVGVRQALRTRSFWLLSAGLTAGILGPQALSTFQIPYLVSLNYSAAFAGVVVSVMAITSTAGRLGFGWLGDYLDKRKVLVAMLAMEAVGLFFLASLRATWMVVPFLLLYAPSWGGTVPLRPGILADYYGRKSLGSIQGVLMAVMTLAGVLAPIGAGLVFDISGSYRPAFYALAAVTAMGVPLMLLARKPIFAAPRAL